MSTKAKDEPRNAAQLREQIDRGGAADKVAFSDPAAAPLGTDDEAAGHPPSREQVAHAARAETGRADPAEEKKDQADLLQGSGPGKGTLIALCLAVAAIVVVMVILI
ncbi:hypothetical protein [Pseudooceanicola algae]|uniref:Uncharacterized protein n=1 Tax=Pseudooceanicola algae TaxID=1537215 RepID=A0A418SD48_9RHOB|nr:hypothetical protein [Pseudooceanicola algae]QPM92395.1 hypothetical protein PSAL_036590 [Pseudooceanicola algae]